MRSVWRTVSITVGFLAVLAGFGCSSPGPAPVEHKRDIPTFHTVVWGETLSEIALRYGVDYQQLAAWNRLTSPDRIYAGQRLRIRALSRGSKVEPSTSDTGKRVVTSSVYTKTPLSASSRPYPRATSVTANSQQKTVASIIWRWPTQGRVERGYQPDVPGRKGIQIGGRLGQSVQAASTGEVVYSGSGLPGYGRLIIVKHSETFLSAYGYLGRMLVREGDRVEIGQTIAELGTSGENRSVLHFEIRKDGRPVDPLHFLPT